MPGAVSESEPNFFQKFLSNFAYGTRDIQGGGTAGAFFSGFGNAYAGAEERERRKRLEGIEQQQYEREFQYKRDRDQQRLGMDLADYDLRRQGMDLAENKFVAEQMETARKQQEASTAKTKEREANAAVRDALAKSDPQLAGVLGPLANVMKPDEFVLAANRLKSEKAENRNRSIMGEFQKIDRARISEQMAKINNDLQLYQSAPLGQGETPEIRQQAIASINLQKESLAKEWEMLQLTQFVQHEPGIDPAFIEESPQKANQLIELAIYQLARQGIVKPTPEQVKLMFSQIARQAGWATQEAQQPQQEQPQQEQPQGQMQRGF